jgi:hypothetical protein
VTTVFVATSVAPNLDYVWLEVLEHLSKLRYPSHSLRAHLVSHLNHRAKVQWDEWAHQQHFAVSSELFSDLQPSARPRGNGGYAGESVIPIMAALQCLRKKFLISRCDYALMVECDQLVPPDIIERLMAWDKPIVMAATPARHRPTHMNCSFGEYPQLLLKPLKEFPPGLVECTTVGIGCTLIRRDVLENVGWENPKELVKTYGGNGPDATLCLQTTEILGFKPCVDTTLDVVHVEYGPEDHAYYHALKPVFD